MHLVATSNAFLWTHCTDGVEKQQQQQLEQQQQQHELQQL